MCAIADFVTKFLTQFLFGNNSSSLTMFHGHNPGEGSYSGGGMLAAMKV